MMPGAVLTPISVVIPVGPRAVHRKWLPEAIQSINAQTRLPGEVVIIDDGGNLDDFEVRTLFGNGRRITRLHIYHLPCNMGVVAALNAGVALAFYDLVLLGCADDAFLPNCVERCWQAWEEYQEPLGYYFLGVKYSTGEEQNTACGAAMVTKELWRYTGGFPAQASVGAADHIFLSALIAGSRDGYSRAKIIKVAPESTYWYRRHADIETAKNVWPAIEVIRSWFTENWRPREGETARAD